MTVRARTLAALGPLALLAACATAGPYRAPAAPLAPAWSAANALARPVPGEWWRAFGDPALDALQARAAAGNPDLEAALARVDQARAAAGYAEAARLPAAELAGTLSRARQSTAAGLGQLVSYVPNFSRTQNEARATVGVNWDLDFAGGQRRQSEAARANLAGATAGLAAARLAVAAELADAYFGYRGAEAQLATMLARRAALADRRGIMAARLRVGEVPASALDQLDAALAGIDALLPLERAALTVARNRIAVLMGLPAGSALPELDLAAGKVPQGGDPAAGMPGDILRYRPDVVAAEARVHAAHARIGAALSEYWPKLSLGGAIGFDTNTLSRFGSGASSLAQGLLGLRWRLFDFGRVDAEVKAARGGEREALAAYRAAVLRAGEDVEGAFTRLAAERAELTARLAAQGALERSLGAARAAHAAGEISRDRLREAELDRLEGDDAVTAARVALARAVLACHRALGG